MTSINDFKSASQLTTAATAIVSTSSGDKKILTKLTLTNTSASNVNVTIWRLPTATTATTGSGGNWSLILTVPANRTITVPGMMGHVLGKSMTLSALADTASVINIDASGILEL